MKNQPQLNIELKNTTPIKTLDGNFVVAEGFILRKVSKFLTGTSEDGVIPIPVFYDVLTKKIILDTLPLELRKEFQDLYDQEDSTK